MTRLDLIQTPLDVRSISAEGLRELAAEIRSVILETVSRNGGHLASNLGTVELTIALLRVFSPPQDKIIWDVGHQAYTWKLLTGRRGQFHTLRQKDGLSGFTKPDESPYDVCVAGHAGTALSTALGLAVGRDRMARTGHVLAVIGDASITNGISLEALNNLEDTGSKVIVVLNDNEMSISENVGALSRRLGRLLANARYNRIKTAIENLGHRLRMTPLRWIYHRLEHAIKSIWLQQAFFEEFGLRYIGPIDGHDFVALENGLVSARESKDPVLVHVATRKGRGFPPAEQMPSQWHGVGAFDIPAGHPPPVRVGYSQIFGETLTWMAENDPALLAITAAMCSGTGLEPFAARFPKRFFDVGMCEEHAVVFAAGLAAAGYRPVFAVYSTFMQRAVDCVMHDVCLQNLPVTFCLDRAGVVGSDGPTHHGIYDIAMLRCLPNLLLMQPADHRELVAMMKSALAHQGPAVIRYPREPGPDGAADITAAMPLPIGQAAIVLPAAVATGAIWFWALGDMIPLALETARCLQLRGCSAGVVNARFIKPLDIDLLRRQAEDGARMFVTLENGARQGGFGSAVAEALSENDIRVPVRILGWPDQFMGQGTFKQLLEEAGLEAGKLADRLARDGSSDERESLVH